MNEHYETNFALIEHNDKTYYLVQDPYISDRIGEDGIWTALAHTEENEDGEYEEVRIIWTERDGFDGDDTGDACDWDNFEVIE